MPLAKRRNAAANATRTAILDAAERLLGLRGVDAVSVREIGVASGCSNHFAVQYHFGDKAKLLRAIFERRLPSLEAGRARLLARAERAGRLGDPAALIEVLLTPLAAEVDEEGRCSYASFMLGLHHQGAAQYRFDARDLAPLTLQVNDLLRDASPHLGEEVFQRRLSTIYRMFLDALHRLEFDADSPQSTARREAFLSDALAMAIAAFCAPVGCSPTLNG